MKQFSKEEVYAYEEKISELEGLVLKLLLDKKEQAKQLALCSVSQQRELLLAYEEYTSYKVLGKKTPRISKQMVEDYLANNCG